MKSKLIHNQKKTFTKNYIEDEHTFTIDVKVRYDDECRNGHNSFSITGTIYDRGINGARSKSDRTMITGGCIHDDIYKHFPKLRKYIKWHLMNNDGPMHYLANTLYLASDKDYNGKRKGEPLHYDYVIRFGNNLICHKIKESFLEWLVGIDLKSLPIPYEMNETFDFEVIGIDHNERETFGTKYTFSGYGETWYDCPFDTEKEALDFLSALQNCKPILDRIITSFSEGKEPELEAARNSAIWPDATLEQLQDEQALKDRLPGLIKEFKKDVESLGFTF